MQDQFGNPVDSNPEEQTIFQKIAAGLGIALIVLGVCLGLYLFVQIIGAIRNPQQFATTLDAWEKTLRGEAASTEVAPSSDFAVEIMDEGSVRLIGLGDSPTSDTMILQGGTATPAGRAPATFPFRFWRPVAVFLIFALTGLLLRIVFGMLTAGANLLNSSHPYRKFYEEMVKEMVNARQRQRYSRSEDFAFDDKES